MRREPLAHLGVLRQIERGLAFAVLERAVGAALEQEVDGRGIAELGGDHQRGAAAIVGVIEAPAVREQKVDDALDRRRAHALVVSRRPHHRA